MRVPAAVVAVCLVAATTVGYASSAGAQSGERQTVTNFDCTRSKPSTKANVAWKSDEDGVRWGEWRIRAGSKGLPLLVVVTVIAPQRVRLMLDVARDGNQLGAWSLSNAPPTARIALNAGQFTDDGPWGWVVHRGREHQAPGSGALAGALVVDSSGKWAVLDAAEIALVRDARSVYEAVQSYPTLIGANGVVPAPLCAGSTLIDRAHRDTRLAVGTLPSGELLIAMTRFDALGSAAGRLPLGPTTPEMSSIMHALGATRALMLDGGLSAQLMIRGAGSGSTTEWPGLRSVPLALVGLPVPQ